MNFARGLFAVLMACFCIPASASEISVKYVQLALGGLGYDPGIADGLWGAKTGRAIEEYFADSEAGELDGLLADREGVEGFAEHLQADALSLLPRGVLTLNYGPGSLTTTEDACLEVRIFEVVTFSFTACQTGDVVYEGTALPLRFPDKAGLHFNVQEINGQIDSYLETLLVDQSKLGRPYLSGTILTYTNGFEHYKGIRFTPDS